MRGRQKAVGSTAEAPGTSPIILAHAFVPSSIWRFQRSKSCWVAALLSMRAPHLLSYRRLTPCGKRSGGLTAEEAQDRGASQRDTRGQQCIAAPRPAIREMCPPGSSTYSLSPLPTAPSSAFTLSGGAI